MPEVPRHHRQMLLPGIGEGGQAALASAHVLVAGCGALGSIAIDQLARAGVGTLTLVDRDVIELTNLQRQTLYTEKDVAAGAAKADAAARRVREIDSLLVVHPVVEHLGAENVLELLHGVTLVVDGLDNFPTRYLLNDACVKQKIPLVYGGAVATGGMSMTIIPGRDALPALRLSRRAATGVGGYLRYRGRPRRRSQYRCQPPGRPGDQAHCRCDRRGRSRSGFLGSLGQRVAADRSARGTPRGLPLLHARGVHVSRALQRGAGDDTLRPELRSDRPSRGPSPLRGA